MIGIKDPKLPGGLNQYPQRGVNRLESRLRGMHIDA